MDLSNQTVFLDAAAIPLDHDMLRDSQQHILKVQERGDMVLVKVNEVELLLWRHLLPAFAERCREWKHKVDLRMEYQGHFYRVWQALHVQLWNGCLSERIS
ncbi:hypothetical protein K469DRAFT_714911, partial [Zopfia rhizophila CBS 207.26]